MKLRTIPLAVLAAFTIAGPASAATLLFADNFDSGVNNVANVFSNNVASSQSGSIGTTNYAVTGYGGSQTWVAQHGGSIATISNSPGYEGGNFYTGNASLNNNFATQANATNEVLQISFNILNVYNSAGANWVQFNLGNSQSLNVTDATVGLGMLFRINQGTQTFSGGGAIDSDSYVDGNLVTILLSNTAGTGSAFNGNGSVAKVNIGGTDVGTYTLAQQTNAYVTFGGFVTGTGGEQVVGEFDNLSVSAIPEPGAATLLGGLGMLALLRRRR